MKRFPKDVVIAEAHRQAHDTEYLNKEAERDSGPYKFVGSTIELPDQVSSGTKLQFFCREYLGLAILDDVEQLPITQKDDLKVGQRIYMGGLQGYHFATVTSITGDKAMAESEHGLWSLEFGKDDRKCWVSTCGASKKAIERVKFE